MMQHAHDEDAAGLHRIENAVLLMNKATIGLAIARCRRACLRMFGQQVKCRIEAQKIRIRRIDVELIDAIKTYLDQIGSRRRAELNLNHAKPDVLP